jgi:hypothetical protein
MKIRTKLITSVLAIATGLSLSGTASAGQIGLKLGLTSGGNILPTTTAGALTNLDLAGATFANGGYAAAQTNWNNLGRWGGLSSVIDQSGAASGVLVQWDCNGMWNTGGSVASQTVPDNKLMCSYEDSTGAANTIANDGTIVTGVNIFGDNSNKPWMYITNLSAWLAAQGACSYDVVIYAEGDTAGRIGQYWVEAASGSAGSMTVGPNLTPFIFINGQTGFVPNNNVYTLVPTTSSTGAAAVSGNFTVFPGLTANTILIRSEEYRPPGGTLRSPMNAIQIIPQTASFPTFPYPMPTTPQTNYGGATASFFCPAAGCVTYQWQAGAIGSGVYTNLVDGGNLWGSTTAGLTITNLALAQTADYVVVVSNGAGKATNTPTTLVVQPAVITTQPQSSEILYPSGTAHFIAAATGTGTLGYQWLKNGIPLTDVGNITGSATTTLTVSSVGLGDAANYALVVTNSFGSQTSIVATLTVLAAPPTGSFAECAMTNKALAYWRLGELSGPTAFDYAGGLNGTYLANSLPDQSGPQPTDFLGFESTNTCVAVNPNWGYPADQSWVTIPALNLNTNTVTIVAWVNLAGPQQNWAGILTSRQSGTQAGFNFSDTKNELVYTWNNNTTWQYHSGLIVSNNIWSLVALVVTPTNATFYCGDTNFGVRSAFITLNNNKELFYGTATIGVDDTFGSGRALEGYIDEVAVFTHSLSADDITRLWVAGRAAGVAPAPTIVQQPAPQNLYPGRPANFSVVGSGLLLNYQWRSNGVNLANGGRISGATAAKLTVSNVQASDAVNYDVVVSNTGGSVTSSVAPLTLTAPTGAGYEAAVIAAAPSAYWRLNEPSGSTSALDYYGGFTATYGAYSQTDGQGVAGPQNPEFTGFESINTGLRTYPDLDASWVTAPPLNLNTNTVTITAWINPSSVQNTNTSLVFQRQGLTVAGLCFDGTGTNLSYNWNNAAAAYNWGSGLTPPLGQWSLAALVVEPTRATLYLYNASSQSVAAHLLNHPVQPFAGVTYIGSDPIYAGGPRNFNGVIDEVAIWNRALSGDQIAALYTAASSLHIPPSVALQPNPLTLYAGLSGQISMTAAGSGPLYYQWLNNGVAVSDGGGLSGTATATLNVTNAALANTGNYSVIVSNSLNAVTSSVVALTVLSAGTQPVFAAPAAIGTIAALTNQAGILVGAETFGATEYVVSVTNSSTVLTYDFKADGSVASATGNGTLTGAFGTGITGYTNTTGNANYDLVLGEASYDGGPKTLTVNGLLPGRQYTLQLISLDDRDSSGGQHREQSRRAYFQDPYNATNVSTTFYMSNNYYVKVTFTAASTNQIVLEQLPGWADGFTDVGDGNLQAVVVRDILSTPAIVQQPASMTRYLGFPATFNATGYGTPPVTWQWQRGSGGVFTNLPNSGTITNPVNTAMSLTVPAVSFADAMNYRLILTNSSGAATSQVATLTVLPKPSAGSYEAAVLSYGPLAYWQLDETAGSPIAFDYAGGFNGTYGVACTNGVPGVPTPPFSGFPAGNLAAETTGGVTNSWVTVPGLNLNTNTVTFTAWIYPSGSTTQADWAGILMTRSGIGAGIGYGGASQTNANMLGYTWNGNSGATYGFISGLTIPSGQWSFVAVAISPTNAALYLINTGGMQTTNNAIAHTSQNWAGVASIGQDSNDGALAASRVFSGVIDEVAVFPWTLSPTDIANVYAAVVLVPPAAAPTGLTATAGDARVSLSWNATTAATGYNVKRSSTSGGPYTTVGSSTGATFTDTGAANGTLYYYVVSALNTAGESPNSTEASARPTSAVAPHMVAGISGGQIHLTWPVGNTGWLLQGQTNAPGVGLTTNWVAVPGSTNNNTLTFPTDGTQGSVFFRLVYP